MAFSEPIAFPQFRQPALSTFQRRRKGNDAPFPSDPSLRLDYPDDDDDQEDGE